VDEFGRIDSLVNNVFAADRIRDPCDAYATFRHVDLDGSRRLIEVKVPRPRS
jgi:hypothetical protein